MKPERFFGDADGVEMVVDKADDGTPLADCRGWTCRMCEILYATREAAEVCCVEPDAVVDHRNAEGAA